MEQKEFKNRQVFNLQLELIVWFIIALIVGFRVIYIVLIGEAFLIFKEFYFDLLISIIVLLFPFLFKLIYSEFPFQYTRNRRLKKLYENEIAKNNIVNDTQEKAATVIPEINEITISKLDELEILKSYIKQSQKLSEQIFSRSSAYLLIGCLIAFAGVGFFYFQSVYIHTDTKISTSELGFTFRETLPRLGVLIFVEAIAFFFLKQYKATMEEFRYYESIKRQRENQYLIASCGSIHKENEEYFTKLVSRMNLTENPNKILKDETTQIIEAQKISGAESDVIEKFINLLKILQK
jgi:hypothetical protein